MHISSPSRNKKNGFFAAFGIFGLSCLTYPFVLLYTRLLAPGEILTIYRSPASFIVLGALLLFNFLYVLRSYRIIGGYLAAAEGADLDRAQKTLIEFPRKIIAMSLVFTVASFQIVLFSIRSRHRTASNTCCSPSRTQ